MKTLVMHWGIKARMPREGQSTMNSLWLELHHCPGHQLRMNEGSRNWNSACTEHSSMVDWSGGGHSAPNGEVGWVRTPQYQMSWTSGYQSLSIFIPFGVWTGHNYQLMKYEQGPVTCLRYAVSTCSSPSVLPLTQQLARPRV